jgi:hypothetical protein
MVLIPDIIPYLYPPGSDEHGLPMEPTSQTNSHLIPDNESTSVKRE